VSALALGHGNSCLGPGYRWSMCMSCSQMDQAYVADMRTARARLLARLGREGLSMRVRKLRGVDREGLKAGLLAGEVEVEPHLFGMTVGMTARGYDAWKMNSPSI
jgi:hypothetical protein